MIFRRSINNFIVRGLLGLYDQIENKLKRTIGNHFVCLFVQVNIRDNSTGGKCDQTIWLSPS